MIERSMKIEMGDGDVLIACAVYDGKGVLFFREKESGKIGNVEGAESELTVDEIERSPLLLTFRNRASILAMKLALDKLFKEMSNP